MFELRYQSRSPLSIMTLTMLTALFILSTSSCKTEQNFPDIATNFSGPIDIVSYDNSFYVLNSDFDRRYNRGSILKVDAISGEKTQLAVVPRLGRSLFLQDQYLIATFDPKDLEEETQGSVRIYSINESGGLDLTFQQDIPCSPINAQFSPSRRYGVITCTSGNLYVASFDPSSMQPSSEAEEGTGQLGFKRVREYRYPHRALYIYEKDDDAILFGFPTDLGEQTTGDFNGADVGELIVTPREQEEDEATIGTTTQYDLEFIVGNRNEVPDTQEAEGLTDLARQVTQRFPFQYFVYPLSREATLGYPFKTVVGLGQNQQLTTIAGTELRRFANNELKYIYYNLPNPLATPGGTDVVDEENQDKPAGIFVYRTNFWSAQRSQTLGEFYLSQRGLLGVSGDSNNVLKIKFDQDRLADILNLYSAEPAEGYGPYEITARSDELFQFSRLAGFSTAERQGYPGDFEVASFGSNRFLFVNQFRDEAYWPTDETLYAVDAKILDDEAEIISTPYRWQAANFSQSAYQLASTENGYLAACSFYGDSLILFDIDFTTGLGSNVQPRIIE